MSSYVYATFCASKAATELVRSKLEFESFAARHNIVIKNIWTDNGFYSANLFHEACLKNQQDLTFCVVGAHWQNGIAERFISMITKHACTILLRAMAKWPDVVKEDMWTFALRHAVHFHNFSLRKDQTITPFEAFTGQSPHPSVNDFCVFGSPVYVLHKELQDGSSLGKWKSRTWTGVYVGNSTCYSSGIPLIYNPVTTHISPQFHVIYDENFHTVSTNSSLDPDTYLENFFNTSAHLLYKDAFSYEPYDFESLWDDTAPQPNTRKRKAPPVATFQGSPNDAHDGAPNTVPVPLRGSSHAAHDDAPPSLGISSRGSSPPTPRTPDASPTTDPDVATPSQAPNPVPQLGINVAIDTIAHNEASATGVQAKTSARPQYIYEDRTDFYRAYKLQRGINGAILVLAASTVDHFLLVPSVPVQYPNLANIFSAYPILPPEFIDTPIHAYPVVDNKADTLTQSQMLKTEDQEAFLKTQPKEMEGLLKLGVFDIKHISTKLREARLLNAIWSYQRKQSPIGEFLKYKSLMCVDGSQQEYGRDYWDVYAPVVSWPTIRLLLLPSTILNLKQRQIDYTQAFPQAPLDDPVYMHVPQGWYVGDDGSLLQHTDPIHQDRTHYI
jgi:hypothetical protein